MPQLAASPLRVLINAVPAEALRELVLALVLRNSTGAGDDGPDAGDVAPRPGAVVAPPAAAPPLPAPQGDLPKKRPGWTDAARAAAAEANAARRQRNATARRAQRAAVKRKAGNGAGKNGNGHSNGGTAEVRASAFWQHAEALAPGKPWRAVAREFNLNEALTLDCHRRGDLPPGVMGTAIERFLELPIP